VCGFITSGHANGFAEERLGARHLVAMHWGTFKLTDEPPARIVRYFKEQRLDRERLWVLDVGETRTL